MFNKPYQRLKNGYHFIQAHWWRWYSGRPDLGMKIYGVTGTNGKTTTSHILARILQEEYGQEAVGMLTTIAFWTGGKEEVNKTKMTTMDSRLVFRYLRRMREAGVKEVVLEVTSHALDQNRLAGIRLDGAIILNITREHLDYHRTMAEYARAKLKIVNILKTGGVVVFKEDDSLIREGLNKNPNIKIPAVAKAMAGRQNPNQAQNPNSKVEKIVRGFTTQEAEEIETPLCGEWNRENALAAMKLAQAIGIKDDAIRRGVDAVKQVPGRMEVVEIQNPSRRQGYGWQAKSKIQMPKVLIDYAVTPDSLENLYGELRRNSMGKIFAVLGACGNRDRGKRPLMTQAVAKYADEIVLTREDPWTENEEQVFGDLEAGLNKEENNKTWRRIADRREAIEYCLEKARGGDTVVVTGKGAEEGMAMGKTIIPWNDKEVILELLNEIRSK